MPDVSDLLERESRTVDLAPGDFERLLQRRDHKARQRRVASGALAVIVMVATLAMLLRSFMAPVPVDTPPGPVPGPLAYFLFGDLWVSDWDGQSAVRIADGARATGGCPDEYASVGSTWSPDGRYLAARRTTCEGGVADPWDVAIFDRDGGFVTEFPTDGWNIDWSPDSTRIATWTAFSETIGIFGLDGELEREVPVPPGMMAQGDFDPVWSPDGGSVLLPDGVVVPVDGSDPYELDASDPWSKRSPTPSPEGSRIAYRDRGRLWVAASDGTDAHMLVDREVADHVWSPNGEQIAVAYRGDDGGPFEVRLVDVATGDVTEPIGMSGSDSFWPVEYSPDGDRILVRRTSEHTMLEPAMWIMNADGSGARWLVAGQDGDWAPA